MSVSIQDQDNQKVASLLTSSSSDSVACNLLNDKQMIRYLEGTWSRVGPRIEFPGYPSNLPDDWTSFVDANGNIWYRG